VSGAAAPALPAGSLALAAKPTRHGDWRKNGLKMVVIGLGAAAAGFLIGRLYVTSGHPTTRAGS